MEIYRIESLKKESLWYSFDGKFEDKLNLLLVKVYQCLGKILDN